MAKRGVRSAEAQQRREMRGALQRSLTALKKKPETSGLAGRRAKWAALWPRKVPPLDKSEDEKAEKEEEEEEEKKEEEKGKNRS